MPDYRTLTKRVLLALLACTVAVVICYFWIDRPVAFYVYHHNWASVTVFKWLTYPPPIVQTYSPLVLALLMLRRGFGPLPSWQRTLFVACLSLLVADQFRQSLGDLFGRYWPETWINNNPSLIGTDTYGFHAFEAAKTEFKAGDDIGSFPSGHSARIAGFASVWWLVYPRSRSPLFVICAAMLFSLVAMDYHFVGDVVAGVTVGAIVGVYATCLAELPGCQAILGQKTPRD